MATPANPALWAQAITRGGVQVINYVDVYRQFVKIGRIYPKSGSGSVTQDFVTGVRSQLTCSFGREFSGFLQPGNELAPVSGFNYGTGSPDVLPLGFFPLTQTAVGISTDSDVDVSSCQDRYQWVVASTFPTPFSTNPNLPIRDHLSRLVTGIGFQTVINTITSTALPGVQTWDQDRSQAIGDLCKAVGAEAFVRRDGAMILQDRQAISPSTAAVTLGTGNGGRLIDASFSTDTSDVYNSVTITPANTDPAFVILPVTVRIWDSLNPAFPQPGGVIARNKRLDSALYTSTTQATAAAQKYLTLLSQKAEVGTLTCIPDQSLDAGATILVALPGGITKRVQIQQITFPLNVQDEQSITTVSTRMDESFLP